MKSALIPLDFSANATNALKYANAFAQATKRKLVLLNVYEPSVGKYNNIPGIIAEEIAGAEKERLKKIENLTTKYVKVPSVKRIEAGDPLTEIMIAAEDTKADMIIMGTHGATGFKRVLFGSNAANVIAKARIPVLAIPQRYRYKEIRTIVYASDLSNSLSELNYLIPFAKSLDATIEVLNINYGWGKNEIKRQALEQKLKGLKYKKIVLVEQKAVIEQTTLEQIKKYLQRRKPELLVMFPGERSWFDKLFLSSKTEELAQELRIPLLSIRKAIVK